MRTLNRKQKKALARLSLDRSKFLVEKHFPFGIGNRTLESLVQLGLAEIGPSKHQGWMGWRITEEGWRACPENSMKNSVLKGERPSR